MGVLYRSLAFSSLKLLGLYLMTSGSTAFASPRLSQPAIVPNLLGFGTQTVAGSGRHLKNPSSRIHLITNLNDSGKGSVRACAEARGPRTCIPLVGGVVRLSKAIRVRSPFLTLAGQTAPSPGLTLTQAGLSIETHDVLIQHIAIRPGDSSRGAPPQERDGISIGGAPPRSAYNVVVDHVSLTWAIDENISTAYPLTHDVTISNSIVAEGLHNSIHPKGPHSKGIMVGDGSRKISIIKNLVAFNEERNPYLKPGTSTEFLNNVVYGWGIKGGWSLCNLTNNTDLQEPVLLTFVGNIYRPSPESVRLPALYAKKLDPRSLIYAHDNVTPIELRSSSTSNSDAQPILQASTTTPPVASALRATVSTGAALTHVLSYSGARPSERDAIDARIVHEVATSSGSLKDCTIGCARATGSVTSSLHTYRSLRLPKRPFADTNRDGYTNLENWLHRFSRQLEGTAQAPTRGR
jgi:hypothetical protein